MCGISVPLRFPGVVLWTWEEQLLKRKKNITDLDLDMRPGPDLEVRGLRTTPGQVTVSGQGFQTKHRSGQVSGQGFQKQRRSGQVSGQGVPET